ncbi:hypothetical protein ABT010_41295 [Streptomyces sp. NPDC002668]|uniref:hypothetical protein n=1 Tax=Streptomyces sp. NPDC002668 TaxID=3154422 RepID=UPI0033221804
MHPARWVWGDGTRSTVGWIARARLDTAALAIVDADRLEAKAVTASRPVRAVLNTALAAVLNGLGHVVIQ